MLKVSRQLRKVCLESMGTFNVASVDSFRIKAGQVPIQNSTNFASLQRKVHASCSLKPSTSSSFCQTESTHFSSGLCSLAGSWSLFKGCQSSIGNMQFELPPYKESEVYTFPEISVVSTSGPKVAPSAQLNHNALLDKIDPSILTVRIYAPAAKPAVKKHAVRMMVIKRRKIKKHKLIKRLKRNWHQIQKKWASMAKQKEDALLSQANALLAEAKNFNPEAYVKDIISRAKQEPTKTTPAGKAMYPHWKELMTIEQLYGLPDNDYIDKKACMPDQEDLEEIKKLKKKYYETFQGVNQRKNEN